MSNESVTSYLWSLVIIRLVIKDGEGVYGETLLHDVVSTSILKETLNQFSLHIRLRTILSYECIRVGAIDCKLVAPGTYCKILIKRV